MENFVDDGVHGLVAGIDGDLLSFAQPVHVLVVVGNILFGNATAAEFSHDTQPQ